MSSYFYGSTPGPIELPVTAYHHHDVESLSDISRIPTTYYEITEDEKAFATPKQTRTRPPLSRVASRTYPEGGLKGWSVVFGSFCGMMASFGFMATIGVFQEYLMKNQLKSYSSSSVGWIFSTYVFLSFFGGLGIGPIFDIKGPRILLVAGTVFLISGIVLMGISTAYWHFILTIGILCGVGSSLIFTPAISSVGHFFLARRALATGIAACGGATGGIVFPLMLNNLLPRIGWAWATRVLALICLILGLTSIFLVKANVLYSSAPSRGLSQYLPDLRILRRSSFAWTTAGVFFMEWGLFIPIAYIASFALERGAVDEHFAPILVTLLNTGSAFGRFVPGFFADRIGRFNSMILLLIFCGVAALGLWLPATLVSTPATVKAMTISFALLFGFASGANISLTPVCVGQLCKTDEYGRYYATCYTLVSFGTLTGIPIAGMLLKVCGGGYLGVVIFTSACYVLGTLAFTAGRAAEVGWGLKRKDGSGYIIF